MSLLVVGSIALDSVKTPEGEVSDALGGSAVYFSFAARMFTPVHIVGVVGEDFPQPYWTMLRSAGIDLTDLRVMRGKTFRWSGVYEGDMSVARTLDTQLNVFQQFEPRLSPASFACEFIFLANIHPALQQLVLTQVPQAKWIFCDTMNLWIHTQPDAIRSLLRKVTGVVLNDQEARLLTRETNLIRAAKVILGMGPRVVIIKKGEHGALVFHGQEVSALPAFPLEQVADPTGAGDTFAGGVMGCLAQAGGEITMPVLKRAVAHGIVVASFCCESFGLERLKTVREEEVQARLNAYRRILSLGD